MVEYKPTINYTTGIGMANLGNTCFVNSILQVMLHTSPISNYLSSSHHSQNCQIKKANMDFFCCTCALEKFYKELIEGESKYYYISPEEILENLREIGNFVFGYQYDAHEFFLSLYTCSQKGLFKSEELLRKEKFTVTSSHEQTTMLSQLFGGYFQSQRACVNCGDLENRYEFNMGLNLDLTLGPSIEEALMSYCKIEKVTDWKCSKCNGKGADRQITIREAPHILAIQLKRFDYDGRKLNNPVAATENLDLSKYLSKSQLGRKENYKLYGVVVHFGGRINSGHYVSFVKINDTWWLFDDTKVIKVNESIVLKQNAYILFYQKTLDSYKHNTQFEKEQKNKKPEKESEKDPLNESNPLSLSGSENLSIKESKPVEKEPETPKNVAKYNPKCDIYFRFNETEMKTSFILSLDVSKLTSEEKMIIKMSEDGQVLLETSENYYFHIEKFFSAMGDFPIDLQKTSVKYFSKDKKVVIFAEISDSGKINEGLVDVIVNTESTKSYSLPKDVSSENKLETPTLIPQPNTVPRVEEKVTTATKKQPTSNKFSNKLFEYTENEASYSQLYKDIESAKLEGKINNNPSKNPPRNQPVKKSVEKAIGRNDKCPCGSGKKFKICHGKN